MANKENEPAKKTEKKLARTYTEEDVKKALKRFDITISPHRLMKEATELWNEFERADDAGQKVMVDKLHQPADEYSRQDH